MQGKPERGTADQFDVRRLYDMAPVGLGYFNASLKSCYLNQRLATIIGHSTYGYLSDPLGELPRDFSRVVVSMLRELIDSRKPIVEKHVAPPISSSLASKRYSCYFYPDMDGEGSIVGIFCVVADIVLPKPSQAHHADSQANASSSTQSESDSPALATESADVVRVEQSSQQPAEHDRVTGLGNWALFEKQLRESISVSERTNEQLASLVIGLDGFREFGDLYGPAVSDELLREIGDRLAEVLREGDQKFRIVGSEFAVLLAPSSRVRDRAHDVAEKIAQHLVTPVEIGGKRCALGVSIGVAIFPTHGRDAAALFGKAVEAMYRAKREHQIVLEASRSEADGKFDHPQTKVFRLVYVSTAVRPMSVPGLVEMMKAGRVRSERLQITGMLLYKAGHFIHVLEGEESKVREILADAEKDREQRSVDVLRSGHFYARSFPDWTMGFEGFEAGSEPAFTRFLEPDFEPDFLDEDAVEAHAILLSFKGSSSPS
jgi:diguanylate cyclase (GGDEF)-like protein